MDTSAIAFINRFFIIALIVTGMVLINYPPTRPAIQVPHRKMLTAIGIAYITYQVIIAANITSAPNHYDPNLVAFARVLETVTYIAFISWGIICLNERTAH